MNLWKLKISSIDDLAYKLHIESSMITKILKDFWLFVYDEKNDEFYSERLLDHFEKRDQSKQKKSDAWKKWMAKRWAKHNSVITEDNKGKESKINEIKEETPSEGSDEGESDYDNKTRRLEEAFEKFWEKYPKKTDKRKSRIRFMNLNLCDLDNLSAWLDQYIKKWKIEDTAKQYIPGPCVWLNGEKWCDEIIIEWSDNDRSQAYIDDQKKDQQDKDDKQAKESQSIQEGKKKISQYWNNLSQTERDEITDQAKKQAMKRNKKTEEQMEMPYAKYLIKAEIWVIIKWRY